MKNSILCILLVCIYSMGIAQENKTITVNTLQQNTAELTRSVNKYPAFVDGKVVFKDSAFAEAKMNFNRLSGQVLFIRPKGDTLMLAHPETIDKVILATDTFYYYDHSYLQRVTHFNGSVNLYEKQTMKYIGKEKKGPYGTYTPLSAANSNTTFTNDDQATQYLAIDENALFKFTTEFYLSDRFYNYFPTTKSRFYKLFFNHEKKIHDYIDAHKTNFHNKEDIAQLLQYVQSL